MNGLKRAALAVSLLGAVGLVGCTGNVDFSLTKTFDVISTGTPNTYSAVQAVDLSTEAGSAWSHRSHIKSIDLVSIQGTITAVTSGAGTNAIGSLYLRPETAVDPSQDVLIGTWSGTVPTTPPETLSVTLPPAALTIVNDAIHGDGKFSVVASGSTDGPADFTVQAILDLKLTYNLF